MTNLNATFLNKILDFPFVDSIEEVFALCVQNAKLGNLTASMIVTNDVYDKIITEPSLTVDVLDDENADDKLIIIAWYEE